MYRLPICRKMFGKRRTYSVPVSYTHLDVYKRQDQTGVGKLMEMAIKLGKSTRPDMHVGICGEHGGDPTSVEFCHKIGLDYVSCSPFRVPIARPVSYTHLDSIRLYLVLVLSIRFIHNLWNFVISVRENYCPNEMPHI